MSQKTQSKMAQVFAKLAAGDVISHTQKTGQAIVISTRPDGGKQLGIVCGCGQHVEGLPNLFYWDEDRGLPATKEGMPLTNWDDKVVVDKEAKAALAEEFSCLACEGDYQKDIDALKPGDPDTQKAFNVLMFSNADTGHSVIAALRAIGAKITPHQAAAFIVAMLGKEDQDSSGSLVAVIEKSFAEFVNSTMRQNGTTEKTSQPGGRAH